jgi:hypothetical protein
MNTDLRRYLAKHHCAVIGYPQPLDAARIATVIAQRSRREDQIVWVITSDVLLATQSLANSNFLGSNIQILNYDFSDQNVLTVMNSLIVFDSLCQLLLISPDLQLLPWLKSRGNIVIVLITFGVTEADLTKIRSVSPEMLLLWTAFITQPYSVEYVQHASNMTAVQDVAYENWRAKELALSPGDQSYLSSERACNIFIAETSQYLDTPAELSVAHTFNLFNSTKHNLLGFDAKIHFFDSERFLLNAPKIKDLLTQLRATSTSRHVIYTRYARHSGVEMLTLLLTEMGFPVVALTAKTPVDEHLCKLEAMESAPSGIIITSVELLAPVSNISHLHFLDSGYKMYWPLMRKIYRYRLYTDGICAIRIHCYICRRFDELDGPTSPSADEVFFNSFGQNQNRLIEFWRQVQDQARPLDTDDSGFLTIVG